MFCPKCGKQLVDNAAFCTECGTSFGTNNTIQEVVPPVQSYNTPIVNSANGTYSNESSNKKIFIIAGIAVILVVLIAVISIIAVSSGGAGYTSIDKIYSEPIFDDNGLHIFYGKKQLTIDCDGDVSYKYEYNRGKTAIAVFSDKNELFFAHNGKLELVADDKKINELTAISNDGSALLYAIDDELFLFKNGKSKTIGEFDDTLVDGVIAPNGGAVAYCTVNDEYEYECYAYNGKEIVEIGKYYPVSISNNASILYAVKTKNDKLCVIKNLDDKTEETIKSITGTFSYNTTLSEDCKSILFNNDDGTYLYNPSLKEAIKVSKDHVSVMYPGHSTKTLGSFDNFVGYSNGAAYRFIRKGNEFEKNKIANISYTYQLSTDGKKLIYMDGDKLYLIDTVKKDAEKIKIGKDVYSFCGASDDLKHIYYISDNELLYTTGKEDSAEKIYDDVNGSIVSPNGVCVFTDEDEELYYSNKGKEKKKVEGIDEVDDGDESGNIIFIISDDEVYISSDGCKFEKADIEIDN